MISSLTDKEINDTVLNLKKLKPGFLPLDIFYETTRLLTIPTVEIIAFSISKENIIEIFLSKRSDTDPSWPGLLHIPGTVILSTDLTNKDEIFPKKTFKRLKNREFKNIIFLTQPIFVCSCFRKRERGAESNHIFFVEIKKTKFNKNNLYPITNLPLNIIPSQMGIISKSIKKFKEYKRLY